MLEIFVFFKFLTKHFMFIVEKEMGILCMAIYNSTSYSTWT